MKTLKIIKLSLLCFLTLLFINCGENSNTKSKDGVNKKLSNQIYYLNLRAKKSSSYQPLHIDLVNRFAIFSKLTYKNSQITKIDFAFEQVKEIPEDPNQMFRFELKDMEYMEGPYDSRVIDRENVDHTIILTINRIQGREPTHNLGTYKCKSFDIVKGEVIDIVIRSNYDLIDHVNKPFGMIDLGDHICRNIINDDDN